MTVLITGARGFIGRHLTRRLQADGHPVAGLGRGPPPEDLAVPWVTHPLGSGRTPGFPEDTESVVHLAFLHPSSGADEASVRRVNVDGTREALEAAVASGARRFVLASSGAVYGHHERPVVESDPLAPEDAYGRSKADAETAALDRADEIDLVVLRMFFPYGPGQTGRLVPGLIERVLSGATVPIHPGGRPRINPVHIGDLVEVIVRSIRLDGLHTLNVAGPETTDIIALVQRIAMLARRTVTIEERLPPVDDLVADTTRMVDTLGIEPATDLTNGLRKLVEERVAKEVT